MAVRLLDLDVYALLDADTDEAHTFTTYSGYWTCLSEHIEAEFGPTPYVPLSAELQDRRAYRKLAAKPPSGDHAHIKSFMWNAWSSELAMYLVDVNDTGRLWLANQWTPVQYYATSRVASAWLVARDGHAPETHRGLLRALSAQVSNGTLYPSPWCLCCTAVKPRPVYAGFPAPPSVTSNLAVTSDRHDRAAMMLRTTRDRDVRKRVDQVKGDRKLRRAPNGESVRQDAALEPTTLFDFAWRMRTRSNYGDPAMFYVGTLTPDRSREYAIAVRRVVSTTMFLFEAFLAQKARRLLVDTAVHFIARDRAHKADDLLGDRLRTLGLL